MRELLRAEFPAGTDEVRLVLDGNAANYVTLNRAEAETLARRILEVPRCPMPERFFEVMDA